MEDHQLLLRVTAWRINLDPMSTESGVYFLSVHILRRRLPTPDSAYDSQCNCRRFRAPISDTRHKFQCYGRSSSAVRTWPGCAQAHGHHDRLRRTCSKKPENSGFSLRERLACRPIRHSMSCSGLAMARSLGLGLLKVYNLVTNNWPTHRNVSPTTQDLFSCQDCMSMYHLPKNSSCRG